VLHEENNKAAHYRTAIVSRMFEQAAPFSVDLVV